MVGQTIKNYLTSSEWFYGFCLQVRNPKKRLPNKRTAIVIEGSPRSANTFSYCLAKELCPAGDIASHTHRIASIKAAIRLDLPCVVLVRNPVDAVTSWAQKRRFSSTDTQTLRCCIYEWIWLYRFVERNLDHVTLV